MRKHVLVSVLLSTVLGSTIALPAFGQTVPPDQFDETESALAGTVACNGGPATSIAQVDASTNDVSGSNDDKASNLSATACSLPLYVIGTADDSSSAQDTSGQDDDTGNSTVNSVSLLGGLVTYAAKTEADGCADTGQALSCEDTTSIQNLVFAGRHITGQFTQATTFNAVNVTVQIPGYCTGVALFTGTLTVAASSTGVSGDVRTVDMDPLTLNGTLTCLGLPLASMQVNLQDGSRTGIIPTPPGPLGLIAVPPPAPPISENVSLL